jgi:amino acid transporter
MGVPPSPDVTTSTPAAPTDEAMLAQLGYKQELHRGMSGFSNFAVSFSIISVLAGCITSYAIAMNAGGPMAISIGWPLVGAFVLLVALAMAEICSVFPTAGGLYFWAGRLARRNKRVWAWYVGWFNFLGEVAVTAAIDYGAAVTWMALLSLVTGLEVTAVSTFIAFLVIIGLLMAQYTYMGFDASAHVAEETINASTEAPKGLVRSVWVSILAVWVLLVAVTASIQNYDAALGTDIGLPPAQIFIDAAGRTLGIFLLFVAAVAQFFCGMASVTANSRMSYAFSRDNALPGSRWWSQVNPRTGTPTNSIWLCVVCSVVLTTPALWSTTAYLAVTSIAVIGLSIAYVVPVFLRRTNPDFRPGRWNLGRWSAPIGWVAVVWVGFIVILFMLPPASPITVNTFNYAPIAVLAVLVFLTVTWFIGGRVHFMRDVPSGHDTKPASEIFG